MKSNTRTAIIEQLRAVNERRAIAERPDCWFNGLSVREAQVLGTHLTSLNEPVFELRLAVIHSYTSDLLDPWLRMHAAVQGLALDTYHAPFGLNVLEAQPGSGLDCHRPDITLFMLQREDLHPDLALPVVGASPEQREMLQEQIVERLVGLLSNFRSIVGGLMLISLLPPIRPPALGFYDQHSDISESGWWSALRARLAAQFRRSLDSVILMDEEQLIGRIGRDNFFDRRYWYSARFPFTPRAANELARTVISFGVLLKRPRAKVIVLDADNTLWGGIVGEDGLNGIALGPDYPGNAFVDFQRRLLDLQQRGFVLALCSKNNPQDVQEVFDKHPHQVLRDEHFVARRVNWDSKPSNLRALAEELNLGLDAFVFVDDSDHECAIVRSELPQVEVIQTPKSPFEVPTCLENVSRLEILSLTAEDLQKTKMYAAERQRQTLRNSLDTKGQSPAEYLRSLEMKMRIRLDAPEHVARLAQLSQKTNQFNLTTRRYDEQQMATFIASPDWVVASFSLADIFGDSGIVGLMLVERNPVVSRSAAIDTFLMSCRVIGRQAESAFLYAVMAHLAASGVDTVTAEFLPTAKNKLVENFLDEHGFQDLGSKHYTRQLDEGIQEALLATPIAVSIERPPRN